MVRVVKFGPKNGKLTFDFLSFRIPISKPPVPSVGNRVFSDMTEGNKIGWLKGSVFFPVKTKCPLFWAFF